MISCNLKLICAFLGSTLVILVLNSKHVVAFSVSSFYAVVQPKLSRKNNIERFPSALFSADSKKISRPERKALERQKKNLNEKSANGSVRRAVQTPKSQSNNFTLHSNNISELNSNSSAEDVIKAIKR
jgi:hypothetical protein